MSNEALIRGELVRACRDGGRAPSPALETTQRALCLEREPVLRERLAVLPQTTRRARSPPPRVHQARILSVNFSNSYVMYTMNHWKWKGK